jgi:hypothetical protein
MAMGDNLLAKAKEVTGKSAEEFKELASKKGFGVGAKPGEVVKWLKEIHGVGHGYAMAIAHYIVGKK